MGFEYGYNSHMGDPARRSVNIAELNDRLSHYVGFAKRGEEVVIRDASCPWSSWAGFPFPK